VALTRQSLRENFNADEVHLLLFAAKPVRKRKTSAHKSSAGKSADAPTTTETRTKAASRTRRRKSADKTIEGMRLLAHDDKTIELFAELFDNSETVCGLPGADHLSCFVGKDYANIASAALIPLQHEHPLGVVMLTSRDESRFASGKGVMFLNQLGQLLSRRLQSYGAIPSIVEQ
jgi:uncharacterized protein YigA (DUF484 family)